MIQISLILFGLAAFLGLSLLTLLIGDRNRPWALAIGHGLLAVGGIATLAIAIGSTEGGLPIAALVFFILTASGGAVLFVLHVRNRPIPMPLAGAHAFLAILAVVLLFAYVATRGMP